MIGQITSICILANHNQDAEFSADEIQIQTTRTYARMHTRVQLPTKIYFQT